VSAVTGDLAPTSNAYQRPRTRSTAWWGTAMMITTESMIFAGLLSSYFFLRATSSTWPQGGIEPPDLPVVMVFTVLLWGSSLPVWWAERSVHRGRLGHARVALMAAWLMAAAFVGHSVFEFVANDAPWTESAYGSIFVVTVGLHGLHLVVALSLSIGIQAKLWTGRITATQNLTLGIFSIYWHWVDAVWVFVFGALYLSVRWT
jgi:heme/copper-type cytochrome/quinol oxidase subunit 3